MESMSEKPRRFLRTCQSCGHVAEYKDPATYKDTKKEAWRDVKCKKCKSDDLDYGSYESDPKAFEEFADGTDE